MSALVNLSRAAWKRQPSGRVDINPRFMGSQQIYLCPSVFPRADVSGGRSGLLTGTTARYVTDTVGTGIYCSSLTDRWATVANTSFVIPAGGVKCFLAYFWYRGGALAQSYIVSQPAWGVAVKHSSFGGRCGGWQGSGYFNFDFILKTGALHCLLVIHKNANIFCFLNGKLVAQVSEGTNPLAISNGIFTVNSSTGFNTGSEATTYLAGITNADLFSAALEITANPWILFTPEKSRFYLIPSSGDGLSTV